MKRKLLLLGIIPLLTVSLAACGTQSAQSKTTSSEVKEASSLKKDNSKLKKQISKHSSSETSSSKSSEANSSQTGGQGQGQTTSQVAEQSTNTSSAASGQSSTTRINNAQDALNAARAKYGDGNGNYHWIIMYDASTGQPMRNDDGSYFVKAIDPTQGTMTGTAQSVNVYPDGSMTNN